jgi:curved DNA-binding protein CbpA
MDHYETLGVSKNSDQGQIKAAWRRKARENHPDREGGDAKKMAEVNRAYGVLGEEEKRKHYDKYGESPIEETRESQAKTHLTAMMFEVCDSDYLSILDEVRNRIETNIEGGIEHKKAIQKKVDKLLKRKGRLKSKNGENFFEAILDSKIAQGESTIKSVEETLGILELMLEMLANWEEEPLEPPPPRIEIYNWVNKGTITFR